MEQPVEETKHNHWQLIRDVLSFQLKLAMDGIRDLILSPVSIGSAVWGMIASPSNPGKYYYQLLKLGRRSDEWINLFGDVENYEEGQQSADKYVHKAQDLLMDQYNKRTRK